MVKFVVILGFLISFAAGLAVGIGTHTPAPAAQPPATTRAVGQQRGVLPAALNLTPEQQEKMKKIWGEGPPHGHGDQNDPRRQAHDERDAALQAMLTPEQKAKYEEAQKSFQDRMSAIDREFRDDFQ